MMMLLCDQITTSHLAIVYKAGGMQDCRAREAKYNTGISLFLDQGSLQQRESFLLSTVHYDDV